MARAALQQGGRARSNLWMMIAAVALGLVTTVLVVRYLRTQDEDRRNLTEASVSVVVAKKEIPIGTNITSAMLAVKQITPDTAVASAFSETAQVIGLRARSTVPAGAQLVPGMVVQSGAGDALSFVVPPGKRGVAITGSDVIGGGAHIRPGDFVDVMVTIETWKLDGSSTSTNTTDKPKGVLTILQNVEVLAVSDTAQKIPESGPEGKKTSELKSLDRADNKSVTLAVDPGQAQLLFLAEAEGKVRLALRPFGERDEQQIAPVVEPFLLPGTQRPGDR